MLPNVRVLGAPVGGLPVDIHWSTIRGSVPPADDVRTPAFARNNALFDAQLNVACVEALGSEISYQCGVPHIVYPYIKTPLFVMEALTFLKS